MTSPMTTAASSPSTQDVEPGHIDEPVIATSVQTTGEVISPVQNNNESSVVFTSIDISNPLLVPTLASGVTVNMLKISLNSVKDISLREALIRLLSQ